MVDNNEQNPSLKRDVETYTSEPKASDVENVMEGDDNQSRKNTLSKRILRIVWDSLDKSPEERRFVSKVDAWIMSYVCFAYFVKYLDQTNVSCAKKWFKVCSDSDG